MSHRATHRQQNWAFTPNISDSAEFRRFLEWLRQSMNQLLGDTVQNPREDEIDPTGDLLISKGNRVASITTSIRFVPGSTNIALHWDGTNGSVRLQIFRDDGTVVGPISGSINVTGLSTTTQYFFYPYWDEDLQAVQFVTGDLGTPRYAHTARKASAAQALLLKGRIPLSNGAIAATTGGAAGSGPSGGGSGGFGGDIINAY